MSAMHDLTAAAIAFLLFGLALAVMEIAFIIMGPVRKLWQARAEQEEVQTDLLVLERRRQREKLDGRP